MDSGSIKLTVEQQRAVDAALSGHNICIFGRAGVGKTTVVQTIGKTLAARGKKCQIVCSSGISCDAYGGLASTVHSHYGLQTAELPSPLLIERSLSRNNVVDQICDVDVLVWDEISMSSKRIFELVNAIHHSLSHNAYAFGGIQVLLVGDFWQLKPVRSNLDPGAPIYDSNLFDTVFPHRIELQEVLRQHGSDSMELRKALDQLREGNCDKETERYWKSLSREFPSISDTVEEDPVHIYFRKLPVEMHNLDALCELPGTLITFDSKDSGKSQLLDCPSEKVLTLKRGCKVMLLFNINKHLKNGYQGTFLDIDSESGNDDEQLLVMFPKVGIVRIARKTWYRYDNRGGVLATRVQFPITPYYAMTVHKSQGITLDKAIVHCSQEFVTGQTYVALSRVRNEAALQVINFQQRFLLPIPPKLTAAINASGRCEEIVEEQRERFLCCRNKIMEDALLNCVEEINFSQPESNNDWTNENDGEEIARELFESSTGVKVNLKNVLLGMMCDFQQKLSMLPERFSIKAFLESIQNDQHDDSYTLCIISAANYGYAHVKLFDMLARILWCRLFALFETYVSENETEVHMTNSNFTLATSRLHQLFLTNEYGSDLISAFSVSSWSELDDGQRTLGAQLTFHLFQLFTNELGNMVQKQEDCPIAFNVNEMGSDGKGKIRYIGGWAVRKVLQKSRRYLLENKLSQTPNVRNKLKEERRKIELLQDNVIVPYETLLNTSSSLEATNVTESLQYRERGLLHISDAAYEFFLSLEQARVEKINLDKLRSLQTDMVDSAMKETWENKDLQEKFIALFDVLRNSILIKEIFKEIVTRYFRMGAGQFLRDFRRDYHIKKSLAHRKALLIRKDKVRRKEMKVQLTNIYQDKSPKKKVSHAKLLALVDEVKVDGLVSLYKKNELQLLCDAYAIKYLSKWNKKQLASSLSEAIHMHQHMPCHHELSTYSVHVVGEVEQNDRVPMLKLRRL